MWRTPDPHIRRAVQVEQSPLSTKKIKIYGGTLATLMGIATDWGSWRFQTARDKLWVIDNRRCHKRAIWQLSAAIAV
jgi:hypothetical protein